MESKLKKWNSIVLAKIGKLGAIGIIVRYNDYFDCYTDTEFNFNSNVKYSEEIFNALKYSKLNNRYFDNSDNISNALNEQSVIDEFMRPIWDRFLKSN